MATTNETIFENIVTSIDEAVQIESGKDPAQFSEQTEQKLDDIQTMLKEALGLPEDHKL